MKVGEADPEDLCLCKQCEYAKPLKDFPVIKRRLKSGQADYYLGHCRMCHNEYARGLSHHKLEHWRRNKEKYKSNLKRWRMSNPDKVHAQNLRQSYGMTIQEFYDRLEAQKGYCAICGEIPKLRFNSKNGKLAVDHCHDTGKVRGLLCDMCNRGLGSFKDDPSRLESAIRYLTGAK